MLLNWTFCAKMLREGRKESRGDSLEVVNGNSRDGSMHSTSGEMRLLFLTFPSWGKPTHTLEALP